MSVVMDKASAAAVGADRHVRSHLVPLSTSATLKSLLLLTLMLIDLSAGTVILSPARKHQPLFGKFFLLDVIN